MKTTYILLENSQVMAFEGPVEPEQSGDAYTTDKRLERWDHEMFESKASRLPAVNTELDQSIIFIFNYNKNVVDTVNIKPGEVVPLPGWKLEKVYQAKSDGFMISIGHPKWHKINEPADKNYEYLVNHGHEVRQAYRLVREELKEAEKHDPNGFNGEYIGDLVMNPETKDLKIVAKKVDAVEHNTPDQKDFETEEDFFKACKRQREAKTQDKNIKVEKRPVADSEDGSQVPNPYLIRFENAKRALECCEKELLSAYAEIKRLKPNTDTQESQESIWKDVMIMFSERTPYIEELMRNFKIKRNHE